MALVQLDNGVEHILIADDLRLMPFAICIFQKSDVAGFEGPCLAVARGDLELTF